MQTFTKNIEPPNLGEEKKKNIGLYWFDLPSCNNNNQSTIYIYRERERVTCKIYTIFAV